MSCQPCSLHRLDVGASRVRRCLSRGGGSGPDVAQWAVLSGQFFAFVAGGWGYIEKKQVAVVRRRRRSDRGRA